MITDAQARRLRQFLGEGHPLYRAALKVGMDAKSARKYRHADRLPNESFTPRTWRTRAGPAPSWMVALGSGRAQSVMWGKCKNWVEKISSLSGVN